MDDALGLMGGEPLHDEQLHVDNARYQCPESISGGSGAGDTFDAEAPLPVDVLARTR